MNIYNKEIIDKILQYKSISNREKISRMLAIDANQYCNLGIDSTKQQKKQVKINKFSSLKLENRISCFIKFLSTFKIIKYIKRFKIRIMPPARAVGFL